MVIPVIAVVKEEKSWDQAVEVPKNKQEETSVFQRLHKIHGYHAYCQYDMAFAEISSEEEESSSESEESSSESEESSSAEVESSSEEDSSSEESS